MNSEEIEKKVIEIVKEQFDEDDVTLETSFLNDLGTDLLDAIELVMSCEEAFDIEIPEEASEKVNTVEDAIRLIKTITEPKLG